MQERAATEVEKGKSVRIQKKIFDQFLHQRILMQKVLTGVNRLPSKQSVLQGFQKQSAKIDTGIKRCRREVKQYIKDVTRAQKELFKLSGTAVNIQIFSEDEEESTVDSIYKTLDSNFTQMLPFVEETVDRWNSRTQAIKNIGGHKS